MNVIAGAELVCARGSLIDPVKGERVRQNERVGATGEIDVRKRPGDAEQLLERGFESAPPSPARDDQRAVYVEEK
jgi:hypothetical protein